MGGETPVKNCGEMFFQHEIKVVHVVHVLLMSFASPCFSEARCFVLLPALTRKFPGRCVRRLAGWVQGGQQLGVKAGGPIASYRLCWGNHWGLLTWSRT